MFHGMFVYESGLGRVQGTKNMFVFTMLCSTICLFISPDLDGHRAYIDPAMFHDMFVHLSGLRRVQFMGMFHDMFV